MIDQIEAGKKARNRVDNKGKRESQQQTQSSRDRSTREAETQQELLTLSETERLMEPDVLQERHGRGRKHIRASLIFVLCAGESHHYKNDP